MAADLVFTTDETLDETVAPGERPKITVDLDGTKLEFYLLTAEQGTTFAPLQSKTATPTDFAAAVMRFLDYSATAETYQHLMTRYSDERDAFGVNNLGKFLGLVMEKMGELRRELEGITPRPAAAARPRAPRAKASAAAIAA